MVSKKRGIKDSDSSDSSSDEDEGDPASNMNAKCSFSISLMPNSTPNWWIVGEANNNYKLILSRVFIKKKKLKY